MLVLLIEFNQNDLTADYADENEFLLTNAELSTINSQPSTVLELLRDADVFRLGEKS